MDEDLLAALGLSKDATVEQAVAAATALKAKADEAEETKTALATATAQLAAKGDDKPDPSKYAPIQAVHELQTQVASLTAQQQADRVEDLIQPALADGRLLPALEGWARDLGEKNVAALTQFLDKAAPVAGLKDNQTGGKKPEGEGSGHDSLSDSESAIAAACGITTEQFTAAKKQEAA